MTLIPTGQRSNVIRMAATSALVEEGQFSIFDDNSYQDPIVSHPYRIQDVHYKDYLKDSDNEVEYYGKVNQ